MSARVQFETVIERDDGFIYRAYTIMVLAEVVSGPDGELFADIDPIAGVLKIEFGDGRHYEQLGMVLELDPEEVAALETEALQHL